MVDRDLVTAKLAELEDRITRVRTNCPPTLLAFAADRNALDRGRAAIAIRIGETPG